jgi:hypothetical protein
MTSTGPQPPPRPDAKSPLTPRERNAIIGLALRVAIRIWGGQLRNGSRRLALAAGLAVVCISAFPQGVSQAADPRDTASVCSVSGPIPASMFNPGVTPSCNLVGHPVLSAAGFTANIPQPGSTETNDQTSTSGESTLTVANSPDGVVTATDNPSSESGSAPPSDPAGTDPACSESSYSFDQGGTGWRKPLAWYYNLGSQSRAQSLTDSDALSQIRQGNTNMSRGLNDCGLTTSLSSEGSYQGTSTNYANIDADGDCSSNFPDSESTVSWEPFTTSSTLADTCTYATGDGMFEADIAISSKTMWFDTQDMPQDCDGVKYDLQSVMTHEWGHAFGLGHGTGEYETMYAYTTACNTYKRSLGLGDFDGMDLIYGG